MKDQILDEVFVEEFHQLLRDGEEVIWTGMPYSTIEKGFNYTRKPWKNWIENIWINYLKLLNFSNSFSAFLPVLQHFYEKRTRYIITNQRIIFKLWNPKEEAYHSISFREIKKIRVKFSEGGFGTIFLVVKNPTLVRFTTFDIFWNEPREQPTLEMVGNIELVINYIKEGILKYS